MPGRVAQIRASLSDGRLTAAIGSARRRLSAAGAVVENGGGADADNRSPSPSTSPVGYTLRSLFFSLSVCVMCVLGVTTLFADPTFEFFRLKPKLRARLLPKLS